MKKWLSGRHFYSFRGKSRMSATYVGTVKSEAEKDIDDRHYIPARKAAAVQRQTGPTAIRALPSAHLLHRQCPSTCKRSGCDRVRVCVVEISGDWAMLQDTEV